MVDLFVAHADYWQAIYVNGLKYFEHHVWQWADELSGVIRKYGPIHSCASAWYQNYIDTEGCFPDLLSDLKGHEDAEQ